MAEGLPMINSTILPNPIVNRIRIVLLTMIWCVLIRMRRLRKAYVIRLLLPSVIILRRVLDSLLLTSTHLNLVSPRILSLD